MTPLLDSKHLNRTIDGEEILLSDEDLQSFLQGRANFSKSQKAQIEAYLSKQSASNQSLFSRYLTSTKLPSGEYTPDVKINTDHQSDTTQSQRYVTKTAFSDWKDVNRSSKKERISFSDDDLRSFIEGRANLSKNQKAQIRAYLAKQSSSKQSIFPTYPTSTKSAARKYTPTDNIYPDNDSEDAHLPDYDSKMLSTDSKDFNLAMDKEGILFSDDDLRFFLENRANLSNRQKARIEAYLSKQSSSDQSIFSRYLTSTKLPTEKFTLHDKVYPAHGSESTSSRSYATKTPLWDSKHLNRTRNGGEILFSDDDLRSFVEGRANLSKEQKAQIEAYLSKQSLSNQSTSSTYSTGTKPGVRKYTPHDNIYPDYESEYTQLLDHISKKPSSDSKSLNRTIDGEEILFSDDDLRSFVEGRANLSKEQKAQIEAYLGKQSLSNQSTSSTYSASTKPGARKYTPHDNIYPDYESEYTQLSDYKSKKPFSDSKTLNRTIDGEEILFSDDNLRSFVEGRVNLSKKQQAQIEAYLSKKSSSNRSIFSNYSMSTKPGGRKYKLDGSIYSDFLSEDTRLQNHDSKTPSSNSKDLNRTVGREEILFSDDDLRSFLEGRANLSYSQKAQIEAYLSRQSSLTQSTFPSVSTSTKTLAKKHTSVGNIFSSFQTEKTPQQRYVTKSLVPDSIDISRVVDSQEISVSDDDLQSYLEGRSNLSLAEDAQIRAYLAKQTSLNKITFSRYLTSKNTPTEISTADEKLEGFSEETSFSRSTPPQSIGFHPFSKYLNGTLSSSRASLKLALQNSASVIPITTKNPTDIRRLWQSNINGSNDFDRSIEQLSNVFTESSDDRDLSIHSLNEYSQLSTSKSFISPFQRDTYVTSAKQSLHSRTSIKTPLKELLVTIPLDRTKSDFIFGEKSGIDNQIHRLSTVSSSDQLTRDISDVNLISSTLSINDSSIVKNHSLVTQFSSILIDKNATIHSYNNNQQVTVHDDDDKINVSLFSTKLKSTMDWKISQSTPRQLISTKVQSISFDKTSKSPADIKTGQTSSNLVIILPDNMTTIDSLPLVTHESNTQTTVHQTQISSPKTHTIKVSTTLQNLTLLQNQSNINDTSKPYDIVRDNLNDESINIKQISRLPTLITNDTLILITTSGYINQNIKDEISHKHSSAMSVDANVTSIFRSSLPLITSNTTLLPSRRSPLSSPLHYSRPYSSTKSPKFTSLSSSKLFSDRTTITTTTSTTTTTTTTTTTSTSTITTTTSTTTTTTTSTTTTTTTTS
ncbi:unnamed protein product, partial [Rotaria sp. Silwood2]